MSSAPVVSAILSRGMSGMSDTDPVLKLCEILWMRQADPRARTTCLCKASV